jgi:hypothetical protein
VRSLVSRPKSCHVSILSSDALGGGRHQWMGCTASVASSPSTTAVPEPEVPSAEYFAQELMAAPSKSLDDEQVALINDNKSVQLPKGAAGFVPGDTAKLKGMKTESLNGKTVTLIEWKDKQGRWKVQAEGEKNTIDVLPEKLVRRRRSFTEQLIGLAAPAVRKLSISGESSGGGQPTKIEPMSAEDVAKQAQAELNDQANRDCGAARSGAGDGPARARAHRRREVYAERRIHGEAREGGGARQGGGGAPRKGG